MIYITKDIKKKFEAKIERLEAFEKDTINNDKTHCLISHYLAEELKDVLKISILIEDTSKLVPHEG